MHLVGQLPLPHPADPEWIGRRGRAAVWGTGPVFVPIDRSAVLARRRSVLPSFGKGTECICSALSVEVSRMLRVSRAVAFRH